MVSRLSTPRTMALSVMPTVMPLVAVVLFAAAPTDYSTDMVMLDGGKVMQTMRMFVSGQKSRLEGMTVGPLGRIVTIARKDKGVTWTLYLDRKQYTEQPLAAASSAGRPDLGSLNLGALKKENLGKETVLGYACTKLRVTMGTLPNGRAMTSTVWVADSLDLPIRMEVMGFVQENRNLKVGPQPADLFEIPAGYSKTDSPGMPGRRTPAAGIVPPTPAIEPGVPQQPPRTTPQRPTYGGKDAQVVAGSHPPASTGRGEAQAGRAGGAITIEADGLRVIRCTSGEALPRKLAEDGYADEGTFTGNLSLQWHDASGPGALLELELPVARAGRYAVTVRVARYRTYGTHQFLVNGTPLGKPVDMFGSPGHDIVTAFTEPLGEADFVAGANRLGIRVAGTNPDTIMANHGAGLDWIRLAPIPAR